MASQAAGVGKIAVPPPRPAAFSPVDEIFKRGPEWVDYLAHCVAPGELCSKTCRWCHEKT